MTVLLRGLRAVLIEKEIISGPGVRWFIDQNGKPATIDFTSDGIKHLYEQGKKMLEAGLSVPVPLEHQPEAKPQTAAEKAANRLLNNAGFVKEYKLDGDRFSAVLDIDHEEVKKKLPRGTIPWTSPWVNSFVDGDGRQWDGVVSHLALTTRPRITKQQPFPNIAAAMSLAGRETPPIFDPAKMKLGSGITLSKAGLLASDGKKFRPAFPMAFSLWAAPAALALEEEEKKNTKLIKNSKEEREGEAREKPPKDEGQGKRTPEEKDGTIHDPDQVGQKGGEEEQGRLIDADGDMPAVEVLKHLSGAMGCPLPDETTHENFLENLYGAWMGHVKNKLQAHEAETHPAAVGAGQPPLGQRPQKPKPPVVQERQPMYMSVEEVEKITDPQQKAMAQAMLSMQADLESDRKKHRALEANTLSAAQRLRDQRIQRIAKMLPASQRDSLVKMAGGAALSLGDDGAVNDPLATTLDILESAAKSIPQMLTGNAAQITAHEHPKDPPEGGGMNEERRQAIVESQSKRAGVKKKTAAA